MNEKEVRNKIRSFIKDIIDVFHDEEVGDSDNIFEIGVVSSLAAMRLLQFIEKEFEVQVTDDDILLKNFSSVDNMVSLVKKLNGDFSNVI